MREHGMSEDEACDKLKRRATGDPASMRQAAESVLASLSAEGSTPRADV
jgi:AmiR/NasT family two-component response regulator